MANPVCLSPLKFYDALEKQERYKSYAYGHVSPVIMPFNTLYPFQFILPIDGVNLYSVYLYDAKTNKKALTTNLLSKLKENGLINKTVSDFNVVQFPGIFPFTDVKFEGEYYLEVSTTSKSVSTNTTQKTVLYWCNRGGDLYWPERVFIGLRGLPASEIPNLGLKVVMEDGFEIDCPNGIDIESYDDFNQNKPHSAGIFNERSSEPYEHGHVKNIIATNVPIEIVKMDSWNEATIAHESTGEEKWYLEATVPAATYNKITTKYGPYTFYSEVFCFTNNTDDCLEIEYWNPEADFTLKNGLVTFANNFHFKVLLKSELGKPEYGFEEEATKRLGYNFIESQVSKKTYKFNTVLPEYLCDALRLIRLCSNKILRSKGEEYEMLSFDMDVDWQDQGDLASVNCEFDVDNIIVNLGGFEYEKLGGDYNNDFNDDFKTT